MIRNKQMGGAAALVLCAVLLAVAAFALGQVITRDKASIKMIKPPTPLEVVQYKVEDLEKALAAVKADLKKTQDELQKTKENLSAISKPPAGYTTMMITKSNFDRVEGTALMKFFVRY